jgi:hypothetical protein
MLRVPHFYWQGDGEWGGRALGFSRETISEEGCMVTALAMASNTQAGTDWNPGDVNELAQSAGAFKGDLLILELAAEAVGLRAPDDERIHAGDGDSSELRALMRRALSSGGGALLNVGHGSPSHFVYLHGEDASGFVAADPALGRDIHIDASTLQADSGWNNRPYVLGVAPVWRA